MLQLSSVMTVAHPRAPAAMTSAKAARVQPNIRVLSRCTRQPMTTAANTKMPRSTAVSRWVYSRITSPVNAGIHCPSQSGQSSAHARPASAALTKPPSVI